MELRIRIFANTPDKLTKGLMFSNPLEDDECAFFSFPYMERHAFWNKNVSYNLSLAFLDDNGKIVDFKDLQKEDEKGVYPDKTAKYVIEAKHGIFLKNNIKLGDYVLLEGNHKLKISQIKEK